MSAGSSRTAQTALRVITATLVLHLVLIQPNHPAAMTLGALKLVPLELPAIVLLLLAMPAETRLTSTLRGIIVAVLTVIATLKLADFVSFSTLSRGFNPVADIALVNAAFRLASGALGLPAAIALAIGAALAVGALGAALWWATGVWAQISLPRPLPAAACVGALCATLVATGEVGDTMGRWDLPLSPPGAAFTARVGVERVGLARRTMADLAEFAEAARDDPLAEEAGLFDRLDRDLLIIFVESYGRGALDNPLYAPRLQPALADAEARLAEAGFAMRSGWLDAPTRGGQSWLSHMSLATGLRIDGQTRYAAALASERATLYTLAARAGRVTAAVMPAITLPWPEAEKIGFDRALAAMDLGYAGQPFNWVTMPDQFTLAAMDRLLRDAVEDPVVAQVALISSHAPWVPIPYLVPWDEIGDGRIFDTMASSGLPPERLWRDRDKVREQYGKAVEYSIRTVFDWAVRQRDEAPLMLIVGDHQPAEFVAGDTRPDVPAHLIGPAAFVLGAADWGWAEGLVPAPESSVDGMEVMRDRLLSLVSAAANTQQAAR